MSGNTNLIESLKDLIASEEIEAATALARVLSDGGALAEIENDDDSPEALNGGEEPLWVVSRHRLMIDAVQVAEWTRCAMGTWGEQGRQCSDDAWCVSEDTDGGDQMPDAVSAVLDAMGLEDEIPDVPEPDLAIDTYEEDPNGEFALYWETVGDDGGPRRRYSTLEAATAVCSQRQREFDASNPRSGGTTYLCGFGVRHLVDGKWVQIDGDE